VADGLDSAVFDPKKNSVVALARLHQHELVLDRMLGAIEGRKLIGHTLHLADDELGRVNRLVVDDEFRSSANDGVCVPGEQCCFDVLRREVPVNALVSVLLCDSIAVKVRNRHLVVRFVFPF
jgi:hypothetical protein